MPGRRFFRVVFLIPLTITPVGVGYMLRMMTDTDMGPMVPIFRALGLSHYTWVNDAWSARVVVILADSWQWIPFMFIVLLAAIEGQDQEVLEAAFVDGATRGQAFRHMTVPAILPVSTTLILIRMIESFKMIDMPNILLGGGPGTATQIAGPGVLLLVAHPGPGPLGGHRLPAAHHRDHRGHRVRQPGPTTRGAARHERCPRPRRPAR